MASDHDILNIEHDQTAEAKRVIQVGADGSVAPSATEGTLQEVNVTIEDLYAMAAALNGKLEFANLTDNAKVLQIGVKNGVITTVTTVTTVGTVSSVTNTVRQGDLQMQRVNEALMSSAFAQVITNNL